MDYKPGQMLFCISTFDGLPHRYILLNDKTNGAALVLFGEPIIILEKIVGGTLTLNDTYIVYSCLYKNKLYRISDHRTDYYRKIFNEFVTVEQWQDYHINDLKKYKADGSLDSLYKGYGLKAPEYL